MKQHSKYFIGVLLASLLASCNPCSNAIAPIPNYCPEKSWCREKESSFPPLTSEEKATDWGKELFVAGSFAPSFDLYRAITAYKRALLLMPKEIQERRWQAEYSLLLCYYLGGKYADVVAEFECSTLASVPASFPAYKDMLLILIESYRVECNPYRAQLLEKLLEDDSAEKVQKLGLSRAIQQADFCRIEQLRCGLPGAEYHGEWTSCYHLEALSVRKAQLLNAILPGAGYYYTGQTRTALTSFLLNAVFIAASYKFFKEGYTAAGIITTSLEFGWYFGGINGGGLSAKLYNDRLYSFYAKEALRQNNLYPALMIDYAF